MLQLVHSTIPTLRANPIKKDSAQSIRVEKWMRVQHQKVLEETIREFESEIKEIEIYEPNFRQTL